MKRYHKFIQLLSVTTCTLLFSCNSSESRVQDKSEDSTFNEVADTSSYSEPEKIDIIDTLSFDLTAEDKNSINNYNSLKEPTENYEYEENSLNTIKGLYAFYKGQEQFWWKKTAWAEKNKILSIERMIEEISYNPETKKNQLEVLNKYSTKLKTLFLSRSEISDPEKIPYDDITTALLDTIIRTGESIPKMNGYQTFNVLKSDVDSLHNNLQLSLRRTHIASLDSLNSFLLKNKEELLRENLDTSQVTGWAY